MITAAALAAGCSGADELEGNDQLQNAKIRITTDVTPTRMGHTTSELTEIGFTVKNPVNPQYSYDNVKMTRVESDWTGSQMFWQNAIQAVEILAYAPYTADGASPSVLADQSTEAAVLASDFIACHHPAFTPSATATNAYSGVTWQEGKVSLKLAHMMSRLHITVYIGSEYNAGGIPATNPITLKTEIGSKRQGGLADATSQDGGTYKVVKTIDSEYQSSDITPCLELYTPAASTDAPGTATYEAVLVPQYISSQYFKVQIILGSDLYEWASPSAVTLEGGKQYRLEFTVGKDIVATRSMGIALWDNNTPL